MNALPGTAGRIRTRPPFTALSRRVAAARAEDAWPHTDRWLPWLLAWFLIMLFTVPMDKITLPLPLPVDANPDRVLIPFVALIWIATLAGARSYARPLFRPSPVAPALLLLLGTTILSVLANSDALGTLGELELAAKKVAILAGYVLVYFIVATTVRPSEVRAFAKLLLVLASIMAIGIIFEYRTNLNPFYLLWTGTLELLPGVSVAGEGADAKFGRRLISGPTSHAIAAAAMLGMAVPFAFTGYLQAHRPSQRFWYGLALGLLLGACVSTIRKTGLVAPVAAMFVLLVYRPRGMVKLIPLGVAIILAIQVVSPAAISGVKAQFVGGFFDSGSTQGRTTDYPAVVPDVKKYLLTGRGHGTYDPDRYRFVDNEYLKRLLETGVVGVVAYLVSMLSVAVVGHRAWRARDPVHSSIGLAALASAAVFLVCSVTYDQLSFPHAVYLLYFIAGLATVSASTVETDRRTKDEGEVATSSVEQASAEDLVGPGAEPSPRPPDRSPVDLSVVIVTHNGCDKALATLRSARAAVDVSTEWLVFDSGSTDGTPDEVAHAYPDVHLWRGENVGFAAANNAALLEARGRYVLLLNPDVEVLDGSFAKLLALMDLRSDVAAASVVQRSPQGDMLASIGRFPTASRQLGEALGLRRLPGLRSLQEQERRFRRYRRERSADWLVGAFLLLRREAIAGVGGLDERFFLYAEEQDWCRRARTKGWDVRHIPIMTVTHHAGGYDRPGLTAQLTHSKLLFARKHCALPRRAGIRAALVLRHALRVVLFAPLSLAGRERFGGRLHNERVALGVALGRSRSKRQLPARPAGDVVTAEQVRTAFAARAASVTRAAAAQDRGAERREPPPATPAPGVAAAAAAADAARLERIERRMEEVAAIQSEIAAALEQTTPSADADARAPAAPPEDLQPPKPGSESPKTPSEPDGRREQPADD